MKLIDMAIGGEPVSTLYEKERRFDIVARLDKRSRQSPQAIGRLPVYTADGVPIPLAQVATIAVCDGQTLIGRVNSRRCMTVRCDIVGRDHGGFVQEAQAAFRPRDRRLPAGYRVEWLGMFENLQRAYKHFMVLIPTTIAIIFLVLVVAYGSFRAAFILLLPIPFAFASRGGGPLFPPHEPQRLHGRGLRHAVRHRHHGRRADVQRDQQASPRGRIGGRSHHPRPHRPAAAGPDDLAGGHPRTVARGPGHRPGVRRAAPAGHRDHLRAERLRAVHAVYHAGFLSHFRAAAARIAACPGAAPEPAEPLPDVSAVEVIGLLEYLHQHGDEEAVVRIADDTNRELAHVVFIVKAAELLGFASTPLHMVALTPEGRRFVEAAAGRAQDPVARAAPDAAPVPRSL